MTILEAHVVVSSGDNHSHAKNEELIISNPDDISCTKFKGKKSTFLQGCYNLIKGNIGAGIFSFPLAYNKAGFLPATFLLIFTTWFIYWTTSLLVGLAERQRGVATYESIVEQYLGKWGKIVCSVSAILLTFGALSTYVIIIGDTLPPVIMYFTPWTERCILNKTCEYNKVAVFFIDRKVISVLVSLFIVIPLSAIRNPTFLSYVSVNGLITLIIIAAILCVKSNMPETPKGTLTGASLLNGFNWSGVTYAISATAYANIVNQNQFPILKNLADPSKKNRLRIIKFSLVFCVALMLVYSIGTYIPLNDRIKEDVLRLFPDDDIATNVARILFALGITLSAPVVTYICRDNVLNIFFGGTLGASKLALYSTTVMLIVAAAVVASSFCKFGVAVSLTGGLSASMIAFGLPQLCWVSYKIKNGSTFRDYKVSLAAFSTLFAIVLIVLSFVDLANNVRNYDSSDCPYSFI